MSNPMGYGTINLQNYWYEEQSNINAPFYTLSDYWKVYTNSIVKKKHLVNILWRSLSR